MKNKILVSLSLILISTLFISSVYSMNLNKSKIKEIKSEKYIDGEVIVKVKDGNNLRVIKERTDDKQAFDGYKEPGLFNILEKKPIVPDELKGIHKVKIKGDVKKIIKKYKDDSRIEWIEPNYVKKIVTDDTGYSNQWAHPMISSPYAWSKYEGNGTIIAIIDTGVKWNHPDLQENIWNNTDESIDGVDDDGNGFIDDVRGWDFLDSDNDPTDTQGHGTHCAGIAAAKGNNSIGVAGMCWNCKIMPLRVCQDSCEDLDIANAITYATDNGAKIISMSLGGPDEASIIKDAIKYAASKDVLVISAAGNDNADIPFYPAVYQDVMSVASTDQSDARSSFSNYGSFSYGAWTEVASPGTYIYSTYTSSYYAYMSGTSMATPLVAGLAGLLRGQKNISALQARTMIRSSVDMISTDKYIGLGRINASRALDADKMIVQFNRSMDGNFVKGTIDILGTIQGSNSAAVYFSAQNGISNPYDTNWTLLGTTSDKDGIILQWDTTGVNNGKYIIRLLANSSSNRQYSDWIYININNSYDVNSGDILTADTTLTNNIYGTEIGLSIGASDIVLDCNGHSIFGEHTNSGILIDTKQNILIKNCIIYDKYQGIYIIDSSNITLKNIRSYSIEYNGIVTLHSDNITMTNITSYDNEEGILLFNSTTKINNSTLYNNSYDGIYVENSTGVQITDNNIYSNNYSVFINNSDITIYNNILNTTIFADGRTIILNTTFDCSKDNIINQACIGGNYWVNKDGDGFSQTCSDNNGDGICDDVYNMSSYIDNLALTKFSGNDSYAPVQTGHYPSNNSELFLELKNITFYTNEPAHCRWANSDMDYSSMIDECSGNRSMVCEVAIEDGITNIFISCLDIYGNNASIRLVYRADIYAPRYYNYSVSDTVIQEHKNLSIFADWKETNPDTAMLMVNGKINKTTALANHTEFIFDGTKGNYTLAIKANDTYGHTNTTTNITIEIIGDNIAPNITINQPINTTYLRQKLDVPLDIVFSENVSANYQINNINFSLCTLCSSIRLNATIPEYGYINMSIIAIDTSGNKNTKTINFSILQDTDLDGNPDVNDSDDDGDGIDDLLDSVIGNADNIKSNINDLNISINNSTNLSKIFNNTYDVKINVGTHKFIEFACNFTSQNITFSEMIISKNNSFAIIKGITCTNNKSIYLNKSKSSFCIKDSELTSLNEISDSCNLTDETMISCPGATDKYLCSDNVLQWKISGVSHSGIKYMCIENWSCTSWSVCTSDVQTRNCADLNLCATEYYKPLTSRACTVSSSSSSGSSGGSSASSSASSFSFTPLSTDVKNITLNFGLSKVNLLLNESYKLGNISLSVNDIADDYINLSLGKDYILSIYENIIIENYNITFVSADEILIDLLTPPTIVPAETKDNIDTYNSKNDINAPDDKINKTPIATEQPKAINDDIKNDIGNVSAIAIIIITLFGITYFTIFKKAKIEYDKDPVSNLNKFIHAAIHKGHHPEKIQIHLINHGWPKRIVEHEIRKIFSDTKHLKQIKHHKKT